MPKFNYSARTREGDFKNGIIEASSKDGAISVLQRHNLIVVSLQAINEVPIWQRSFKFLQRVKSRELVIFSRQFATLIESQIVILEALRTLVEQTQNPFFKEKLTDVANEVEGGSLLSEALKKHPKIFSALYVSMVRSGEASGNLHQALKNVAENLEYRYALNSRVRSAMMYPTIVLIAFILIAILMFGFVMPKIMVVLQDLNADLPLITRVMIAITDNFKVYGTIGGLIIVTAAIGLIYYFRTQSGRRVWAVTQLKLPLFGNLLTKIYIARFSENISTLTSSGLPILQALKVSADVVGNLIFQRIIDEAREAVRGGSTIASAFQNHKEVPIMVTNMIRVGEKTGRLDVVLKKMAKFYKEEVDAIVSNLTTLIEPIMIVILGIGAAILVISILMPIYNSVGNM